MNSIKSIERKVFGFKKEKDLWRYLTLELRGSNTNFIKTDLCFFYIYLRLRFGLVNTINTYFRFKFRDLWGRIFSLKLIYII